MLYLTLSSSEPTVFWITNPLVTFENNVAAGTEVCTWYIDIKEPIRSKLFVLSPSCSTKRAYSLKTRHGERRGDSKSVLVPKYLQCN